MSEQKEQVTAVDVIRQVRRVIRVAYNCLVHGSPEGPEIVLRVTQDGKLQGVSFVRMSERRIIRTSKMISVKREESDE